MNNYRELAIGVEENDKLTHGSTVKINSVDGNKFDNFVEVRETKKCQH